MANFKKMPMEPTQIVLFPTCLDDSIPQGSDVRALSEAMELLDWSAVESSYSDTGCPAYPPKVLAKILVYGYSKGIRSSRALEDFTKNDKRFIWLAGGLEPDHSTISRFRKDKQAELRIMYKNTVRVCIEAGLVLLNTIATDGSRIPARASRKSLYDDDRLDRVSEAIDRIFKEAEEADRLEDEMYGDSSVGEVPAELADAAKRREKLREIAERLTKSGRKNVSATDPDCRVMKTTSGLRPAYNVQLTVDTENMVAVAADVTNSQTDNGQLPEQLEQVEENTGCKADMILADTGYSDERTFETLASSGQDALIPPIEQPQENRRNDLFASRCFLRDGERDALICPAGRELTYRRVVRCTSGRYKVYTAEGCRSCSFYAQCVPTHSKTGRSIQLSIVADEREKMKERLKTPEGKALYSLRQQTVELVFGNMKSNKGFDRFGLHGMEGAMSEVWLMCIVQNLSVLITRVGTRSLADYFARFLQPIFCRTEKLSTSANMDGNLTLRFVCNQTAA